MSFLDAIDLKLCEIVDLKNPDIVVAMDALSHQAKFETRGNALAIVSGGHTDEFDALSLSESAAMIVASECPEPRTALLGLGDGRVGW